MSSAGGRYDFMLNGTLLVSFGGNYYSLYLAPLQWFPMKKGAIITGKFVSGNDNHFTALIDAYHMR